jgi:hypothetical protein
MDNTYNKMNCMKNCKLITFLLCLSALLSCSAKSVDSTKTALTDSIPEGAVPFEYDFKREKAILISGILNDSIPLRFLLETGMSMGFSDSLASDFEKKNSNYYSVRKPMTVQIGKWKQVYGDSIDAFYIDKNFFIFNWLGVNATLPWKFFDKKIIEISFSRQYLRELSNIKDSSDYDSVKIEIKDDFLVIPVVVTLQGKEIKEFLVFDTGCSTDVVFGSNIASKYNIKSDSAHFGKANFGNKNFFSLPLDTIKIGKTFLTQEHSYAAFKLEEEVNLIGTRVWENFDLILDLKNYYLYLKPAEKH